MNVYTYEGDSAGRIRIINQNFTPWGAGAVHMPSSRDPCSSNSEGEIAEGTVSIIRVRIPNAAGVKRTGHLVLPSCSQYWEQF